MMPSWIQIPKYPVPKGWILVPPEPTPEMIAAMHTGWQNAEPDGECDGAPTTSATAMHKAVYKALLAAAPKS